MYEDWELIACFFNSVYCKLYLQYLMLECNKLNYILQQQDGDSRVTIHLYIKRNKEYMAQITNYIYRMVKK